MKLIIEGPDRKVEKINTLLRSFKGITRTLEGKKTDEVQAYVPAPAVTVTSNPGTVTVEQPKKKRGRKKKAKE